MSISVKIDFIVVFNCFVSFILSSHVIEAHVALVTTLAEVKKLILKLPTPLKSFRTNGSDLTQKLFQKLKTLQEKSF